jgi:hypothetical protein
MNVSPFVIQLAVLVVLVLAVAAWTLSFVRRRRRRADYQGARQGVAKGMVSARHEHREPRAL